MKWFKSKATKRAEREQAQKTAIDGVQQQIDDANKLPDPADRFMRLEEIKEAIDTLTDAKSVDVGLKARNKFHMAYVGTATGTTAALTMAAIALHFPPLLFFFLAFPGFETGNWAGNKRVQKEYARLMEENKPFFDALKQKRDVAAESAEAILKSDLNALATSSRFEEIVKKAPRVRDHFTAAFARELAKKENPPVPPKNNGGNGFHL